MHGFVQYTLERDLVSVLLLRKSYLKYLCKFGSHEEFFFGIPKKKKKSTPICGSLNVAMAPLLGVCVLLREVLLFSRFNLHPTPLLP